MKQAYTPQQKNILKNVLFFGSFFSFVFGTVFFFTGISNLSWDFSGSALACLFAIIVMAIGIFLFSRGRAISRELDEIQAQADEKERKARVRRKLYSLYKDCTLYCTTTNTTLPGVKEKIQQIAQRIEIYHPDGIDALWMEACSVYVEDNCECLKEKNRYYYLKGRNKRITILNEEYAKLTKASMAALSLGSMVSRSAQQEAELNPYTWGGIANGLAGGAAGIATALETERENAAIRARNAANQAKVDELANNIKNLSTEATNKQELIRQQISHAQTCLIASPPASEVLDLLFLCGTRVTISKNGSFIVRVIALLKNPLRIDNKDAVIDGTVVAHVWEDDKEIGAVNLVLPTFGVYGTKAGDGVYLEGFHPSGATYGKEHTVTFTADNLWLMEK